MHCWMHSHRSAGVATPWFSMKMLKLRELACCYKSRLTPSMEWTSMRQQLWQGVGAALNLAALHQHWISESLYSINPYAGEADSTEITENEALALALALGQELKVGGR